MRRFFRLSTWLPVGSFDRSVRLFLLATIINGVIFSSWQLFFNFFILARGFEKDFLGMVNSIPSIAALLFGIPLGVLSDRMGRRQSMILGIILASLGMGLQVWVSHPAALLIMAFIGGAGNTLYSVSQAPFMMKLSSPQSRALLFSLNYGLMTLSGAVGNLFAGQLPQFFGRLLQVEPTSANAYQAVLIVSVLLGSISLLPIFLIRESNQPDESKTTQPSSTRSVLKMMTRPLVVKLLLPNLLIGFGAAILIPYMNVFFSERFGFSAQNLGVLFSVSSLLVGIGSVIGPRIAANLNSKVDTVVLTQGLSLFFLLGIGFSPWAWLAMVSFLARGVLMNMASPLYSAFSMEQTHPSEQGAVNSIMNMSWTIGWAFGPYVSGLVQTAYGFTPLFITTAVLYALSVFSTWTFFHKREHLVVSDAGIPGQKPVEEIV